MEAPSALTEDEREVVRRFAELYWRRRFETIFPNRWFGIQTIKNPFDAWIIQELIVETRPEVIVESGSYRAGSAVLWASVLEQTFGAGHVLAIDIELDARSVQALPLFHRRVEPIRGSSTDPTTVAEVHRRSEGKRCMLILDADHSAAHVEAELDAYADLVAPGCYAVVEDGFVSDMVPEHGPGPREAVERFLARDHRFEIDAARERMLFTVNPKGYLRRRD